MTGSGPLASTQPFFAFFLSLTALLGVTLEPGRASAQAVSIFSRTANGDVPPLRFLSGPATKIFRADGCDIDPTNNELWVSNNTTNSITVYSRTARSRAPSIPASYRAKASIHS